MNKEKDDYLCARFPLLYRERNLGRRVTCFDGFPGDGWYQLILGLSEKLEPLIATIPEICECGHPPERHPDGRCNEFEMHDCSPCGCKGYCDSRPRAAQVKEKFGGMRYYLSGGAPEIYALVHEAEEASFHICEYCGAPGTTDSKPGGYWLKTLCDACRADPTDHR